MVVELEPISLQSLRLLAGGARADFGGRVAVDGALPPPHVVERAIRALAGGCEALWVAPLNIIDVENNLIVGGCGFKGAPVSGVVEVGYGIAPACQRRGYAYAGLSQLLHLAGASSAVAEVVALISPDNHASSGLAAKLGFTYGGERLDVDREIVQSWHWRSAT